MDGCGQEGNMNKKEKVDITIPGLIVFTILIAIFGPIIFVMGVILFFILGFIFYIIFAIAWWKGKVKITHNE